MEMFLVSNRAQRVSIDAIDLDIAVKDGEAIWTESSYKYTADGIIGHIEDAGFEAVAQWVDEDAAFALTLARATHSTSPR